MIEQLNFSLEPSKTVLMSLREEYYEAMLQGIKRYEYRTRYLKESSFAYIYISKTKKSIVAKITFGKPIIGTSKEIAELADRENPGCYNGMLDYFSHGVGYALPIESITPIGEISLSTLKQLFPDFVVPQSYYILDKKPELLSYLESFIKEPCIQKK